jgi:hypothetical protein
MAVSGGVVERFGSGHPKITRTTTAAVTAGRAVESTGNRTIQHAGAGSVKCVGIAMQTSDAANDKIAVATGGVWNMRAGGTIAAGDYVICGAAGVVVSAGAAPDMRTVIGQAEEAITNGQDGPVRLLL